ncbi:hypothetical protein H4R33_004628 [Dimargaris cristalligena]|nr:hypothetical protein H4R33_004628 [Dimargaris cristalligena]
MLLHISKYLNDRVTILIVFINNSDLVLTILNENRIEGVGDEEVDYFTRCRTTCVSEYVEEQLNTYFGYLKSFVIGAESYTDLGEGHVIAEFSANFRGRLANINAVAI